MSFVDDEDMTALAQRFELAHAFKLTHSVDAHVLSVDFDTATYYNFIYEGMAASASEDETTSPAMAEAIQELVLAPQDIFSRIKVDVYFTEHGFEIATDATLKK